MKHLLALSFLLVLCFQCCNSQDTGTRTSKLVVNKERSDSLTRSVPPARGFINDFVQLFNENQIKALDSLVSAFEKMSTVEISVATVNSAMVKEQDFEDFTLVMLRTWGVGKKDKNNGILIVIAPDLRRMRIQNGYGIEDYFSDAETKEIIDSFLIPKFREGKYFDGTREGLLPSLTSYDRMACSTN